jgi:uncharacterized membrane protein YgcG
MRFISRILVSTLTTLIVLAGQSSVSHAQDIERIDEFTIDVDIGADGDVQFVETITYDFGNFEKHGIFREIPVRDKLDSGDYWVHPVEVNSVTRDGTPEMYSENQDGYWKSLIIGDPNVFVTGVHTYKIHYTVTGALFPLSEKDIINNPMLKAGDISFYWDVIGDQWLIPIEQVIVNLNLPSTDGSLVLAENCTLGTPGSNSQCLSLSSRRAWASNRALQPGEAMTISMQVSASMFDVEISQTIDEGPMEVFSSKWVAAVKPYLLLGSILGIAILVGIMFYLRRRLSRIKTSKVFEVLQFDPPAGHVAEISAAWKGQVDSRAVTATLVDLAARGVIDIQINDEANLVVRKKDNVSNVKNFEQDLLTTLFKASTETTIEGYDADIAGVTQSISANLVKLAEESGIRNLTGSRSRLSSIIGLALSIILILISSSTLGIPEIFGLVFPISLAVFIGFVIALIRTPRIETPKSAEFLSHVLGFRKAMDTDSGALRRKFAQESGLTPGTIFATLLPLAIIFELEDSWLANFVDLTLDDIAESGIYVSSVASLQSSIQQSHEVLTSAMASPTSSGSGSDGGSSSGGGGGGGGGSW